MALNYKEKDGKKQPRGWGDGSVSKVLATEAERLQFASLAPQESPDMEWHVSTGTEEDPELSNYSV